MTSTEIVVMSKTGQDTPNPPGDRLSENPLWPILGMKILLTVDGSSHSDAAAAEVVQQQRAESLRRLDSATATLRQSAPDLLVIPVLREGKPKDVILEEADDWGADLIVVGSQGYGAVRRFFLGSVSLAVATNAHCSVLIVRPPAPPSDDTAES